LPSRVSNSRFRVLKKDSAQALSQQFPFRLMLNHEGRIFTTRPYGRRTGYTKDQIPWLLPSGQ
jgi:hypothetical protein